MSAAKTNTEENSSSSSRMFLFFVLFWTLVFFVSLVFETGKIENGKFVSFTPMPTATPSEFSITVEIEKFHKNEERMCCIDVLWIVKVVESDRPLPQKKFFLGLRDDSKLELKPGTKIRLICTGPSWARDDELSCSQDYEILHE